METCAVQQMCQHWLYVSRQAQQDFHQAPLSLAATVSMTCLPTTLSFAAVAGHVTSYPTSWNNNRKHSNNDPFGITSIKTNDKWHAQNQRAVQMCIKVHIIIIKCNRMTIYNTTAAADRIINGLSQTLTAVCCGICLSAQLRVFALHGERAWGMYGTCQLRLIPGLLHQSASFCQLQMNLSFAVCLLLSFVKCMSSDNSVVRTVSKHGVLFRHMLSPIGANAIYGLPMQ